MDLLAGSAERISAVSVAGAKTVRMAAAGQRVAIIERHRFGGTCVNTGCIPTRRWSPLLTTRITDVGERLSDTNHSSPRMPTLLANRDARASLTLAGSKS
jgi:pyruvate/2-oxoglutarate dehydrogenase complex dihydrolipoamide dehydrogenase (E3) component